MRYLTYILLLVLFLPCVVGESYVFSSRVDIDNKQSLFIGADEWAFSPTDFKCADGKFNAPEPSASCWQNNVNYQNNDYTFVYGQDQNINPYFKVIYTTDADTDYDVNGWAIDDRHTNTYNFELLNKDFISTEIFDNMLVLHESDKKMNVVIRQDLASSIDGGLLIKNKYYLLNKLSTTEKIPMTFKKGVYTYEILIDTSALGWQDYEIKAYVNIFGQEVFEDEWSTMTYNIVDDLDKPVNINDKPNYSLNIGVILIAVTIIGLIIMFINGGK